LKVELNDMSAITELRWKPNNFEIEGSNSREEEVSQIHLFLVLLALGEFGKM